MTRPKTSPAWTADSRAVIFSLSGETLTPDERSFFRDSDPLGFILFARNCNNPAQLRRLTDSLRETLGRACPVLTDQEGGRVQRLKPPLWRTYAPAQYFGDMAFEDMEAALEALRFQTLRLAEELRDAGITVNCAPVLDVLTPETHESIGDRAFSGDPSIAARLGVSVCRTLLASGITPVIKHLPGHGRAKADSHKELPVVDAPPEELEAVDFKAFRSALQNECAPALWGMAAHVLYPALDQDCPASVSPKIIREIIRGSIGFAGLLLSDDLDMQALGRFGDVSKRAALSLEAGCDVALHCSGRLKDMEKIAESVPKLTPDAIKRLQKAAEFPKLAA